MATPFTNFHRVLRVVLADRDPDIHIYDEDQLNDGMTAVLNFGKIFGDANTYAVADDDESIEPDLNPADDTKAYARLIYHTAKLFVVSLTSTAFRTRAFSESFGDSKEFINDVLQEVYELENGDQAS